jgi:spermidine/putrescine transport system substrate-binding protein
MKIKSFIAALLLIALCPAAAQADSKKLYIYIWDTYTAPALFKKFEKETGIKVVTDIYSSNDTLMAKLKAGGTYDVVAPSGNYVPFLVAEKLLQPLPDDLKAIAKDMTKSVQKPDYDPEYTYVLPLFYGTTGLAVNTKLSKETGASWQQFFERPAGEKPSLGVLDEIGTVMNIALLAVKKPFCDNTPETFKTLQALLLKQKPFVKVYGATGYTERLAAGEIPLQMAWNGDVYKARQQNKDLKYVYPSEGVEIWVDNFAIPANSKNLDAAKKFIAFMLKPENAAEHAIAAGMMSSIKAANDLLPEDMKQAPEFNIPEGTVTGTAKACSPEVVNAYSKIWSELTQ